MTLHLLSPTMLSLLSPPRMEDARFCNLVANQVRRAACQVLLKGMRSLRNNSISEVSCYLLSFNEATRHFGSRKLSEPLLTSNRLLCNNSISEVSSCQLTGAPGSFSVCY